MILTKRVFNKRKFLRRNLPNVLTECAGCLRGLRVLLLELRVGEAAERRREVEVTRLEAYVFSNLFSKFWLLVIFGKTLRGLFSAVSTPCFAS